MARDRMRGGARRFGSTWIAIALVWGTVFAGLARGQDLVPAPPDFKPESLPDPIAPPPAFDAPAPVAAPTPTPTPGPASPDLSAEVARRFDVRVSNPFAVPAGPTGSVSHSATTEQTSLDGLPEGLPFVFYRGVARMQDCDFERALDDFAQAARQGGGRPIPPQFLLFRGICCFKCGYLDAAISDLTSVIELYPRAYEVYLIRADAYLEADDPFHALADYDQAVKLRPNELNVYFSRSFLRLRIGDGERALADMDRAVQLEPKECGVYFLRAVVRFLSEGDQGQVLADMDRAIAIEPRYPLFYGCRGFLRAKAMMWVPAANDFGTCFLLRKRAEFKVGWEIDEVRRRFAVWIVWKPKDEQDLPKPRVLTSTPNRECIELAMQRLVTASFERGR